MSFLGENAAVLAETSGNRPQLHAVEGGVKDERAVKF